MLALCYFALAKAKFKLILFLIFFLLKTFFTMLMEHAFYETTIGVKWNVCEMDLNCKLVFFSNKAFFFCIKNDCS